MQKRNKNIICFFIVMLITLLSCCIVAATDNAEHNTTTTQTTTVNTVETNYEVNTEKLIKTSGQSENTTIEETDDQNAVIQENKNAKAKTINKVSNNTKSVKNASDPNWTNLATSGTVTLNTDILADSAKNISGNYVLDGNGHTISAESYGGVLFNVKSAGNVTFKNIIFSDCSSVIINVDADANNANIVIYIDNCTVKESSLNLDNNGAFKFYARTTTRGSIKASVTNSYFYDYNNYLIYMTGERAYITLTNVQYNGQELSINDVSSAGTKRIYTSSHAKALICLIDVQNAFKNNQTIFNFSLFNQTVWDKLNATGNVNYNIYNPDGTLNVSGVVNVNRGMGTILNSFTKRGIYRIEYQYQQNNNFLPVTGNRYFTIYDALNIEVPENITRYSGQQLNIALNLTNSENEKYNSTDLTSSSTYNTDPNSADSHVRFYYNTTEEINPYTRYVINGVSQLNIQVPYVTGNPGIISYPDGYYYSYDIISQFMGDGVYVPSTNYTTKVFVLREPTNLIISNSSGSIHDSFNKNITLTAIVRDIRNNFGINQGYITFKYNNQVLGKAPVTDSSASIDVVFNESIIDGTLYAYFDDEYENEHTWYYANSSNSIPLTIDQIGTTVESTQEISDYYQNQVKIIATVKDSAGNPITSGVVTFKNGDNELENKTLNSSGMAEYEYTIGTEDFVVITSFYNGTNDYENSSNTTTVTRLTIPTVLSAVNVSSTYKVDETFNFTVQLNDTSGNPLPGQDIIVVINGVTQQGNYRTDENGSVPVSLILSSNMYDYEIVLYYLTDYVYNSNTTSITVNAEDIELIDTEIIPQYPSSVNVSDNFEFTVEFHDEYGTPLELDLIEIFIDESSTGFTKTIVGDVLHVSYPTTHATLLIVELVYHDIHGAYNSSFVEFTVPVVKVPTTTYVDFVNNTAGNVSVHVWVMGEDGVNINEGNVTINYRGSTLHIPLTTDDYVPVALSNFTDYGTFHFTAEFDGTVRYQESYGVNASNVSQTFNEVTISPEKITFNVTANNSVYVTENVTIHGFLLDGYGNPISNRQLWIRIIDEDGHILPDHAFTGPNGEYSYVYTTENTGTYKVNVTYVGSESIEPTTVNTSFVVNLIPTSTVVDVYNATSGNFTISVNVTDTRSGIADNRISTGNLIVIVDGDTEHPLSHTINATESLIVLNAINTITTRSISVTYQANDYYNTSSASMYNVNPTLMASHINLTSRNAIYNGSIIIEGTVYDDMGTGIAGTGLLTFTFNDTYTYTESVTSDINGKFSITVKAFKTGSYYVNATFAGVENIYAQSNATDYFNVSRMHTNTVVIIDSEGSSHLSVLLRVFNDSNVNLNSGIVNLTVHDTVIDTIDLSDNHATLTREGIVYLNFDYDEDYLENKGITDGIFNITAIYYENENYTGSNDTYTGEDIEYARINVTVNASSIFVDERVNITVNVTDNEGHPIRGHLFIRVNGDLVLDNHYISGAEEGIYSITYSNTTAGEYVVVATLESALYATVDNTTAFNITKIPTRTNVSIHNNSWGNASIDITVFDARTNTAISTGNISVTINNLADSTVTREITDSVTNIVFDTQYANTFRVTVNYRENNMYLASEGRDNSTGELFREFEIVRHSTAITVNTDKALYGVEDIVTITGRLTDVNTGNAVNNSEVVVSINNNIEGRPLTDNDGYYTFTYKPTSNGTFNISVHYAGASIAGQTNNFPADNNTTFAVNKKATTTNVRILNNTYGNVTISVNVKDSDSQNVSTGNLFIQYGTETLTYTVNANETVIVLPNLGIDEYPLNVTYQENYKYLSSNNTVNASINVDKQYANVTVETNTPEVYVHDELYIHGTVTDVFNHPLNGEVLLVIHDESGDKDSITVNLTNGFYYYYRYTTYSGPKNVTASYINTTYHNSTATAEYNVIRIPTNTSVEVVNKTIGNITIDVTVLDKDNHPVASGTLNITKDGTLIKQVPFTDGRVTTQVPSDDRTTTIRVIYTGDDIYVNSTGKNSTGNEDIVIETVNQTARINLTVNQTQAYVGQSISINLTLHDGMGNPITSPVELTFTGEDGSLTKTVNVVAGKYGEVRTVNITGRVNVTVKYAGNQTIDPINDTTSYVVDKIPTSTTIRVLNTTVGNLSISVTVRDTLHDTIFEEGNITIEYATNTTETVIAGSESFYNLTVRNQAPVTVRVNFTENATHAHSFDIYTTGTLELQHPTLTITAADARVGDKVTISGALLDGMGKAMADTELTFNVNGTALETRTGDDGSYSVNYTATHIEVFTANATFAGNSMVSVFSNATTFTIRKVGTNTSVSIVNATLGNVQISINITDEDNQPVTTGYVNVSVDNVNTTVQLTGNENIITLNDITTTGSHDVRVEYLENTRYVNSTGNIKDIGDEFTSITVENMDSRIVIIEIIPNNVPIDYNVTVEGYLHDAYNSAIKDAKVNLTFIYNETHNDSFIVYTNNNGEFSYIKHTEFAGPKQVIAHYDGNNTLGINPSTSETVSYTVSKRDTISFIELSNNTYDNLTYKVWFTDRLNGSFITEGSFTFIINNTESSKHTYTFGEENENITFNADGTVYIRVSSDFYAENVENYAYITYESNDKYNPSNRYAGAMLDKKDVNVIVTVYNKTVYLDEEVTFNVKLVNVDGMAIAGDVNITVGNTSLLTGDTLLSIDQNGRNFTYTNDTSAFYDILVQYYGSGAYNPSNGTDNFTINKFDTETLVTVESNVFGNVSIAVKVNNTIRNNPVRNGTIRVTYANDTSFDTMVNTTGDATIIPIAYPNYSTSIDLKVDYLGDVSYMPSNNNTSIHVEKQTAILTVNVNKTNPYIGDEVLIYGQLINPLGHVADKEIYIVINNTPLTARTNASGHYNVTYDHELSLRKGNGTMNVTVERAGNESVYYVQNSTIFTVYKLPTSATLTVVNNTVGNVQVNVTVRDVYDRIVETGIIEFYNSTGDKITEARITGSNTTVHLPITASGDTTITGKYLENDVYLNSTPNVDIDSPLENITIANQTSILTLSVNSSVVEVGQSVTINGTLFDDMANPIDGEEIVHINISGVIYHVNVTNGQFKLENINYTAGIKSIIATYDGNITVSNSTNNTEYTVILIPTRTVMGLVNSTVGNVTISVNVTNNTGDSVNMGELLVTVNDITLPGSVSVSGSGETFITITDIQDLESVRINVVYEANNVYNTSRAVDIATVGGEENTTLNITPTKHASIIEASLVDETVYVGQNITIRGTLVLDNGTSVDNENVTVTIGNRQENVTVTDGIFEYNYTTSMVYDGRVATIKYNGTGLVLSNSTSVSFNVIPVPTSVIINVTSTKAENVTLRLYVNDTVNNKIITTANIYEGILTYYVNGEKQGNINLNDSDYREVLLDILDTYGVNARITVEFNTTDNRYLNSTSSTSFIVTGQNGNITINATPNPAKVGQTVTVNGTLTDDFGRAINGTDIILLEYSNGYSERVSVDSNGIFTTTFTPNSNGTYNVSARFRGNNQIVLVTANTSFDVEKIATSTSVEMLNSTVGNVTIKVVIRDNDTNIVSYGQANISINDVNVTVNITGNENIYKLNITTADSTITIGVEYLENYKYLNSTGYDEDEQSTFDIVTVKQNATITVTADPIEAIAGHLVVISGTLFDGLNNPITGDINLTFNGMDKKTVHVENGLFSDNRISHITGRVNVTATYLGNATINPANGSFIYHITKVPTKTIVNVLNNTLGNLTVEIRFIDDITGYPITTGSNFTVTLVGVEAAPYRFDLDNPSGDMTILDGRIILKLDDTFFHEGRQSVNITFLGNETYANSSMIATDDVLKDTTIIRLIVNDSVYINQTVTLNITLMDSQERPFAGSVNVSVGTDTFTVDVPATGYIGTYSKLNISQVYPLSVEYLGNDINSSAAARANITVNRIPTVTNVTILNTTYGNVTIKVSVNDSLNDKYIRNGTIIVTFDGVPRVLELNGTTDETIFTLNVAGVRNIAANVKYNGSSVYEESYAKDESSTSEIIIIEVEDQIANLTVNISPNNTHVGNTSVITGKLVDGLGNNISGARIDIDINGTEYHVFTDDYGNYEVSHEIIRNGTFTVNATWNGNSYIDITRANTTLTVEKVATNTTAAILDSSAGNVTIEVNVTDKWGKNVSSGKLLVNMSGDEKIVQITGNTTIVTIPVETSGSYDVNITFLEDTKYLSSTAISSGEGLDTITVSKQNVTLTVDVVRHDIPVGTYVYITGKLLNASGDGIIGATVNLTFNGLENTPLTTRAGGLFNLTRLVHISGEVEVTANYTGDDKYNNATDKTHYNATKLPTNTTVSVVNTTVENVTIDVEVWDMMHNTIIDNGTLNVTINNVTKQYNMTGILTVINLNITNTSDINITVVYLGNETYENSTGVDRDTWGSENPTVIIEITPVKQDATLTIREGPSPVYVYNQITYNGTLVDGLGQNITGKINITIMNATDIIEVIHDVEVINGVYSYTRTSNSVGEINVTASYAGNSTINPANATTTYIVNLRPTITLVNVTNNTAGNVSIAVQVLDGLNKTVITDGNFTIKVHGQPDAIVTINDSIVPVKLNVTTANEYLPIAVLYNGNTTYDISSAILMDKYHDDTVEDFTNITVELQMPTITIEPISPSCVGDTVSITGNVKDGMDKNIVGRTVTVEIGETLLTNTTDADGNYQVYYTSHNDGVHTATASIRGNSLISNTSTRIDFNVRKLNTTTKVDVLSNIAGNVTIAVNVTGERGNVIDYGEFSVTIDEINDGTYTITDESTNITLNIQENGTYRVNVTYIGDYQYNTSENITDINVIKQNTTLTVGVIRHEIPITTAMIISGTLLNASGMGIGGAIINITFNDAESVTVTTLENGYYSYTRNTSIPGSVTVKAYYNGSRKYNNATNDTHYTVFKLDTNTTVRIVNNTVGNVLIDVVVYDMYHTGLIIENGTFNVTVNNKSSLVDFTTRNTTIKLNITNTSLANVSVVYMGNVTYMNSTGVVLDSFASGSMIEFTNITADKQNATILLDVNGTQFTVFDAIRYNGTLTDGQNNPISDYVNITLSNKTDTYTDKVIVDNGAYALNRTTNMTGIVTVTVSYPGNATVNPVNITATYVVEKRNTTTSVEIVNNTISNLTISVTVRDALNNSHILENGVGHVTVTTTEGSIGYTITGKSSNITVSVGDNRQVVGVDVRYDGNGTYNPSSNYTTVILAKHNSTLTINVDPSSDRVGTTYNISGNFKDIDGTPVIGAELTITVNNTRYTFTTVDDGYYSINHTTSVEGEYTVTVAFNEIGNDLINTTSNTTTFTSYKVPTNTTVSFVNSTIGNVTLSVNVTENDTTPITGGTLNITVGTKTVQYVFTEAENIISLKELGLNINSTSPVNIKVVYTGSNVYINSTGKTVSGEELEPVVAQKGEANITVNVEPGNITIENVYDIIGMLTDKDGNPIRGATVNITVTGTTGTIYSVNVTVNNNTGRYTYSNNTLPSGTYTINASYSSENYNYTSAKVTLNVNKVNTTTTADIVNNTAGNITVRVIVTDVTGRPVTEGYVNITDNTNSFTVRKQLEENYADVTITDIDTNEEISLIVNYEGTGKYLNSSNSTALESITIETRNVKINATPENTTFADTTVKVNINDATTGSILAGAEFNITDSTGKPVGSGTIGEDGNLIVKVTVPVGLQTLKVEYPGNTTYTPNNYTFTINVTKRPSQTKASIINTTAGNVTIRVNVTDAYNETPVTSGNITITDNGEIVAIHEYNNSTGITDVTTNILTSGNHELIITFNGNTNYTQSSTMDDETSEEIVINVEKRNATIIYNTPVNTMLDNTTINVTLVDNITQQPLANGFINVTLNNTEIGTGFTDNEGNALINLTIPVGTHNIKLNYTGNSTYNPTNTIESITITKRPSHTSATITNAQARNTSIKVNITDNITGKAVTSGQVNITLENGEVVGTGILNPSGVTDILTSINTTGNYTLKAVFLGNNDYNGSSTDIGKVEIMPRSTNITVTVANDTMGNTTINITITDNETGEPINGTVNITLPDGTNKTVNVTNGTAIVPVDIPDEGGNITITYPGDDTNNNTNTTIHVDVNKRESNINADIQNHTAGNVTVQVKVTDKTTGDAVQSGWVNITHNGKLVGRGQINQTGMGLITTDIGVSGKITLVVNYEGNDRYLTSYTTISAVDVTQKDPEVKVTVTNNTQGNTTIEVTVDDPSTGEGLDTNVTVTLPNGTQIIVPIDNGTANITVDLPVGNGTITVTYPGNETYEPKTITVPVNVEKRPTTTTAKVLNTTAGNVTVQVKVTDKTTGKAVTSGPVTASVNNTIVGQSTINKDGQATITTNLVKVGNYTITVTYLGNENYTSSSTKTNSITIIPKTPTVNVTVTNNTQGDIEVNITVTDPDTGDQIDTPVIITLPNGTNITANITNGSVELLDDLPVGNHTINITVPGNGTYNDTTVTITINVEKRPSKTAAKITDNTAGNVIVEATVTDAENGKRVPSGQVTVTLNGTTVGRANLNTNGIASIRTNVNTTGNYTLKVTYQGNANYTGSHTSLNGTIEPRDIRVKVTVENNTVENTTIQVNITDSTMGEGVPNETVSVTLPNGTVITVTTDEDGIGRISTELDAGNNTLTVTIPETDRYEGQTVTVTANVEKAKVKVIVESVEGIVGEKLTLTARVVDEYGNKVNGGNLVFKLNGRTLQTDGRFDTSTDKPMKLKVQNGMVTFTLTADLYLRAGKNITASYSGSYKYESAKGNVAEANIKKRSASVSVSTSPKLVKQDKNIVFTAKITDTTSGTGTSQVSKNAYVLFKINGNTLKDANGEKIKVNVTNGVARYTYHVPRGTSGMVDGHMRDYVVTAVYSSPDYYPDSRATATYNVERSKTTINITSAKVKDGKLSIKAKILDQYGKYVIGNNQVSIKINGKTFKINGKSAVTVKNGVIDLSGINLNGNRIKSLTITTGERQSYYDSSVTTKKIETL